MLRGRLPARQIFLAYVLASVLFWSAAYLVWGGTGTHGGSRIHLGLQGAALNALLIVPLYQGRRWARLAAEAEALFAGLMIASLGIPPWGSSFGLLVPVAFCQILCLVYLRDQDRGLVVADRPEDLNPRGPR